MTDEIRTDDLTSPETLALLELHLRGMHAFSPPGSVHALDVSALHRPGVTVWGLYRDGRLAGIGALRLLDAPQQPLLVVNGDIRTYADADAALKANPENAYALFERGVVRLRNGDPAAGRAEPARHPLRRHVPWATIRSCASPRSASTTGISTTR